MPNLFSDIVSRVTSSWRQKHKSNQPTSDPEPATEKPVTENERVELKKSNQWLYWISFGVWWVLLTGTMYYLYSLGTSGFEALSLTSQVGIVLLLVWLLTSIRSIPLDKIGALTMFGYPVRNVSPGLCIIPTGIFTLLLFTRVVQQRQFPGNPEEVFGGDDKEPLPPGMVRPLRILTGAPDKDKTSPLDIQMVLEFLYFLRVQITDPLIFIITYGTIEDFWNQIRDTGDRVLTNFVTQKPGAGELIANIPDLMKQLEKRFNEVTKDSGVTVIETGLSAPNISHDLAEAIRNIGIATALAKQKVIDAGAEQTKIVKIGEGAASAEAALIQAIEDKLKNASPATIATYAGQKILSDKTTVLGVEGIAQAFGLGKEITSEINRRNS